MFMRLRGGAHTYNTYQYSVIHIAGAVDTAPHVCKEEEKAGDRIGGVSKEAIIGRTTAPIRVGWHALNQPMKSPCRCAVRQI